jgi:type II secretory pathway predicted ATPase ExeA
MSLFVPLLEFNLIRKRQKPIALFIDDAHDLHSKTLI